jgi:hypothetical protein
MWLLCADTATSVNTNVGLQTTPSTTALIWEWPPSRALRRMNRSTQTSSHARTDWGKGRFLAVRRVATRASIGCMPRNMAKKTTDDETAEDNPVMRWEALEAPSFKGLQTLNTKQTL